MGKSFLEKLLVILCVMLGCVTGYGVVHFTRMGSDNFIKNTEDNTLDKEKDSVFFSSEEKIPEVILKSRSQENLQVEYIALELVTEDEVFHEEEKELEIVINPTIAGEPIEIVEEKETAGQGLLVTPIAAQVSDSEKSFESNKEKTMEHQEKEEIETIEEKEWKASEILAKSVKEKIEIEGIKAGEVTEIQKEEKQKGTQEKEMKENEIVVEIEKKPKETQEKEMEEKKEVVESIEKQEDVITIPEKTESVQVFTYPTEIFGQTPVINRSDEYVTYFEFAVDLIETVEAEVKARGLNETALFAKFVVKALFCGVDVKTIKINEPISRSEAALALWLTAQVMEEKGTDTSTTSGISFVTDLENCSNSEKKAIAYLYEQGVISGYQRAGQTFLPSNDLETKDGAAWMSKIKQCWK